MATQDLERVRYVTTNYNYLQGLKLVPMGILFLAWAAIEGEWIRVPNWVGGMLNIVGAVAVLALAWVAHLYYNRTFGRVLPDSCVPRNANWAAITAVWVAGGGLLIGSMALDAWLHPPVILFGLTVAAMALAYYWPRRAFAAHYLGIAGLVALISLLPLTGVDVNNPALRPSILSLIIMGLLFAVGGLFDHLLLAQTLKPVAEAADDQPI